MESPGLFFTAWLSFNFNLFFLLLSSFPRSLYLNNLDCTFSAFVQFFPSLICPFLSYLMLDFSRLTIIPDTSFSVLFNQLCLESLEPTDFISAEVPLSPPMQIISLFQCHSVHGMVVLLYPLLLSSNSPTALVLSSQS